MEGIILGISHNDYISELKVGDLVCIDEYIQDFYTITEINDRFLMPDDDKEKLNEYKYIVKSKLNGLKMNFARNELSKSSLAVFDADKYFNENKKIRLGHILPEDLRNMKFKAILEYNLETETVDTLTEDYLIGLTFHGNIIKRLGKSEKHLVDEYNYFKVATPEKVLTT